MKGSRKSLLSLLMIFLIIGIIVPMFLNVNIEGMEPGNYPVSVSSPLLYDSYDVKKAPGVSKRNASDNYRLDFPHFSSKHCGTNNIRYWRRPNNGKCTPPEMCSSIYKSTEPKMSNEIKNPAYGQVPRVNYYIAKTN